MARIGIFFGTDTGRTRLVAKQIAKKLGEDAAAPVNIGRTTLADFLAWDALIVGSPTLGDGELPGESTGLSQPSWEEFLPQLAGADLTGKTIAIFGLGDQKKYENEFVDAIGILHDAFVAGGARVVGRWPTAGYDFAHRRRSTATSSSAWPSTSTTRALLTESNASTPGWNRSNRSCCHERPIPGPRPNPATSAASSSRSTNASPSLRHRPRRRRRSGHRHPAPYRTGQPARPCLPHGQRAGTYGIFYEYPHPVPGILESEENLPLPKVLASLALHFDA
jgi:flavodoxin I